MTLTPRTPNELRTGDQIVVDGFQLKITKIKSTRRGSVTVVGHDGDDTNHEVVINRLVMCI